MATAAATSERVLLVRERTMLEQYAADEVGVTGSTPEKRGYVSSKLALTTRLHRIEGQVRGIEHMVAEERTCIDILTQIGAVNTALEALALKLLDDHVSRCISDALAVGDPEAALWKTQDLLAAVERFARTR